MPKMTKAQDLQENVRIAECTLREEQRKADPTVAAAEAKLVEQQILELKDKAKSLEAKLLRIEADVIEGPMKVAAAQKNLQYRRAELLVHLGSGDIDRLQALVAKQLALKAAAATKEVHP